MDDHTNPPLLRREVAGYSIRSYPDSSVLRSYPPGTDFRDVLSGLERLKPAVLIVDVNEVYLSSDLNQRIAELDKTIENPDDAG